MDQKDARRAAHVLTDAGIPCVADSRGGWGGSEGAQIWGVRPYIADGLTGNYETREQMPRLWQQLLALSDAFEASAKAMEEHRKTHRLAAGGAPCNQCALLSEASDITYEAFRLLRDARPERGREVGREPGTG